MNLQSTVLNPTTTWAPIALCRAGAPWPSNADDGDRCDELPMLEACQVDAVLHEDEVHLPLSWRKPKVVLLDPGNDLFHPSVPLEFLLRVFPVMCGARLHRFQLITDQTDRLVELGPHLPWAENVWVGARIGGVNHLIRACHLCRSRARVRFLVFDQLMSPFPKLPLHGIDYVVAVTQSGSKATPRRTNWVVGIRDQCVAAGVPFFVRVLERNGSREAWAVT